MPGARPPKVKELVTHFWPIFGYTYGVQLLALARQRPLRATDAWRKDAVESDKVEAILSLCECTYYRCFEAHAHTSGPL